MRLSDPFPEADIEWRIQSSGIKAGTPWGKVLAYVTNRAIMERLDEVATPMHWRNEFKEAPMGGILCGISLRNPDADWVTKWDGADHTQIEAVKGGLSGAMKRAAVQWGIGRYLYHLDTGWADFTPSGKYSAKIDGTWYRWNPPAMPAWALPEE